MINKDLLNPSSQYMLSHPCEDYFFIDEDCLDDENKGILENLHIRYMKRALHVFAGRTRNVFLMSGGYVVKLPKNFDGITDNDWEGSVENSEDSIGVFEEYQYPHHRMVYSKGIPVVFMEEVEPLTSKEIVQRFGKEPEWVMSVDCGQVGVNKRGRLVAYDYGLC